jgi:hypothetical protein
MAPLTSARAFTAWQFAPMVSGSWRCSPSLTWRRLSSPGDALAARGRFLLLDTMPTDT